MITNETRAKLIGNTAKVYADDALSFWCVDATGARGGYWCGKPPSYDTDANATTIDGRQIVEGLIEVIRLGEPAGRIIEIRPGEWHVARLNRRLSKPLSMKAAASIVAERKRVA